MKEKEKVMYICPRCDNTYFQISREEWNRDQSKYDDLAKKAKRNHMCPWMRNKKQKGA